MEKARKKQGVKEMGGEKNMSVETLRGVAILLVVAGHVIGSGPDGGMKIDYPSVWRYAYSWMEYIQMPLFTAIAGWVYALKPAGGIDPARFIGNKARRLLLPMAAVSTLYFLTQYFVPGTNSAPALGEIWRIYLFPYTIFWYLQSLFLIFTAVLALDRWKCMSSPGGWAAVLLCAAALYAAELTVIPHGIPNVFSFRGALNQFPYFLAGVGICRFGKQIYERLRIPFAILTLTGICLLQLKWFFPDTLSDLYRCLLPLWLIPSLFVILKITKPNRFFIFFGLYSYAIYLFHGFGTSGGRILLSYMGISNRLVVFPVSMLIALSLPIIAEKLLSKNSTLATMFLGKPFKTTMR